jgi:choline dehydrogenase-like flavoprotein
VNTPLPVVDRVEVEPDPHGGVKIFADYTGDLEIDCDVLVVGSGPGGAVVAKELAEAGRDVVLVEEGPPFGKRDFTQEAGLSLHRTLREGGARVARGTLFVPTMQAIALGGGSLINSAICARSPAFVFDKWAERSGTRALTREVLDPHYDRVERFLNVGPTDEAIQGERNLRFKKGCDALGISSGPTWRNVKGCKGSGECMTGCRNGAKQSTDVSYVPAAIRAGARVYTSVRAEHVTFDGRRATGMTGHVVTPFTNEEVHSFRARAKTVVLAAGCMATPVILQRSGLSGKYLGAELQLHPGLAIMAVYDDVIDPWKGATQGYHSLHHIAEGMKFEVLWSPPAVLAARLPGLGHDYQKHLRDYKRMAPFDVIIATEHSSGTVKAKRKGWDPDLKFEFAKDDMEVFQRGLGILSDICWASGAIGILPGLHGVPELLSTKAESDAFLRERRIVPRDTITAANHAFGSTRMSRKPEDGVVDERGRVHDKDNLYVADTGVFPGSPAVNPMLTCMAIADRIAHGIA